MKFIKEYYQALIIIILLISIILMGYFWGVDKKDSKIYKQIIAEQDSIIKVNLKNIKLLEDSSNNLVNRSLDINKEANNKIIIVEKDKTKMNEEINSLNYLTSDSLKRVFDSLADRYSPL